MSKISNAIYEIHRMDTLAARDQWVNKVHPLVKFIITLVYIATVVSFPKYDLTGLVSMTIYLIAGFMLAELSFRECLWRLRVVLPLVCAVGLANPFFDPIPVDLGIILINAGVISMLTLMLKGSFTVIASYLFIATTSIEKICYALRMLCLPKIFVTQVLLTHRYITVLLEEAERLTQAYALRAPRQQGIQFKVWGSLTGQLLLRSIDRANTVFESMTLRGYQGDFRYLDKIRIRCQDILYLLFWLLVIFIAKKVPLILLAGNLVGGLFT